jgi:hypothetical protein
MVLDIFMLILILLLTLQILLQVVVLTSSLSEDYMFCQDVEKNWWKNSPLSLDENITHWHLSFPEVICLQLQNFVGEM